VSSTGDASGEREDAASGLTQARAMVVREYLTKKFRIDDARIKTKGIGEDAQIDSRRASRVEILVYPEDVARRTMALPPGADPDKISATFKSGVLEVHILKSSQAIGRSIEIKAA
jgi:Hsp20/alpha crystallin family